MTIFLDPASRIERQMKRAERALREAFLEVVRRLRRQEVDGTRLLAGEEPLDQLEPTALLLGSAWNEQFVAAGQATGRFVSSALSGRKVVQKVEISVIFDQTNDRAATQMRNANLRLVRQFSTEQRRATRQALTEAIEAGVNPRQAARAFRDSIGLTSRQQQAVVNFRRLLEQGSAESLTRQLRDKRFDSTIRRSIREGRPLTAPEIDKMVGRYYEGQIRHRAEVIARTESLRSANAGTQELYQQAIEAGQLRPDDLVREWITARDERVRDFANGAQTSHVTMHGQKVAITEPFTSGAGNMTQAPGQFGIASEDVQCRCVVTHRFTDSAVAGAPGAFTFEIIGG